MSQGLAAGRQKPGEPRILLLTSAHMSDKQDVVFWHKHVLCSVWDTLKEVFVVHLKCKFNRVSRILSGNISWGLTTVVLVGGSGAGQVVADAQAFLEYLGRHLEPAGGPEPSGAYEHRPRGETPPGEGPRSRGGEGPVPASLRLFSVDDSHPPLHCSGPQVTLCPFFPQLAGGVILGVALWLRHDPQTTNLLYLELGDKPAPNTFYVGIYILIAVGAVMMFVGFLGCYGAIQESQCLLGTFFTCLVILFACEVAAGIWGFVNKDQVSLSPQGRASPSLEGWEEHPLLRLSGTGRIAGYSLGPAWEEDHRGLSGGGGMEAGPPDSQPWGCGRAVLKVIACRRAR
nr:PREDICTED: CD81 antigen [Equus przewalskii]